MSPTPAQQHCYQELDARDKHAHHWPWGVLSGCTGQACPPLALESPLWMHGTSVPTTGPGEPSLDARDKHAHPLALGSPLWMHGTSVPTTGPGEPSLDARDKRAHHSPWGVLSPESLQQCPAAVPTMPPGPGRVLTQPSPWERGGFHVLGGLWSWPRCFLDFSVYPLNEMLIQTPAPHWRPLHPHA